MAIDIYEKSVAIHDTKEHLAIQFDGRTLCIPTRQGESFPKLDFINAMRQLLAAMEASKR